MRRPIIVMGMIASVILVFHSFSLSSRNALLPFFPTFKSPREGGFPSDDTPESMRVGKFSLLSSPSNSTNIIKGFDEDIMEDEDSDEDEDPNDEFPFEIEDGLVSKDASDPVSDTIDGVVDPKAITTLEDGGISRIEPIKITGDDNNLAMHTFVASSGEEAKEALTKNEALLPLQVGSVASNANSTGGGIIALPKKKKQILPPIYRSEMNSLLLRNRAAYHSMRPRWASIRDKQILSAKAQIENAPIVKDDQELYAPLFRNISQFKRSYELMGKILKVYVYKEGKKPIYHQPLLKGIYASEGWFMKHMESNKQFLVRDPKKAHLFYMPFSSRYLQFQLYVRNSHNRKNLEQHLQGYVDLISSKYPFWNRTGGADHFLAACHDWAPFETRHTMGRSIRALCNADVRNGFRLAKDVSLPETYVRFGRDPLKDLGGQPPSNRPTLAFYAGNMHGTLRPILVSHWENRDPTMKISGPMPPGVRSKTTYIQHMKSSRYCICPRGYEVNSPRVVESIFYECVPVIISDNYVPPFFEVLNWEAFSVILAESEVPRLKEILESIPEEKYLELHTGVRKAQRHFLWHSKPEKYDLFYMTLHSIIRFDGKMLRTSAKAMAVLRLVASSRPSISSGPVLDRRPDPSILSRGYIRMRRRSPPVSSTVVSSSESSSEEEEAGDAEEMKDEKAGEKSEGELEGFVLDFGADDWTTEGEDETS